MDWDHLRFALAVARTGSLAGAARALRVNHSTVFRRINALEDVRLTTAASLATEFVAPAMVAFSSRRQATSIRSRH